MNKIKWKRLLIPPILVIVLSLFLTEAGGSGEFCPQTLAMRTHSLRYIRGFPILIYRGTGKTHIPKLCTYLVEHGYWKMTNEPEHWRAAFSWQDSSRDGQAIWYREFVWYPEKWIRWTEENPAWAKVFWPQMLEALRNSQFCRYDPMELLFAVRMSSDLDSYLEFLRTNFPKQ